MQSVSQIIITIFKITFSQLLNKYLLSTMWKAKVQSNVLPVHWRTRWTKFLLGFTHLWGDRKYTNKYTLWHQVAINDRGTLTPKREWLKVGVVILDQVARKGICEEMTFEQRHDQSWCYSQFDRKPLKDLFYLLYGEWSVGRRETKQHEEPGTPSSKRT